MTMTILNIQITFNINIVFLVSRQKVDFVRIIAEDIF